MRKLRFSKTLAALLTLTMVAVPLMTACNNKPETDNPNGGSSANTSVATPEQSSNYNEVGTFPMFKETVNLSIGLEQVANVQDYIDNSFTKYLEEKLNVKLTFDIFPTGEGKQKLSLMINGGDKLSDIILMSLGDADTQQYGDLGVFLPLNKYIDDSNVAYYLNKLGDNFTKQLPYITSSDGNLYGVPQGGEFLTDIYSRKIWIAQTWLDKFNLPVPTTTDEFYTTLKTFVDKDANGNGKKDEIGYMGSKDGWAAISEDALMNAFVYCDPGNGYLYLENGKVNTAYDKPQWKAGIEYMNKLVKENLYTPISFTQDNASYNGVFTAAEGIIVGATSANRMQFDATDMRKTEYTPIKPLKGPEGVQYMGIANHGVAASYGFVTKYSEDPDAAFRFLDFFFEPETMIRARYGEKDIDWKESTQLPMNENSMTVVDTIQNQWGILTKAHWGNAVPRLTGDYLYSDGWDGIIDPAKPNYNAAILAAAVKDLPGKYEPEEVLFKVIYTKDETDQINEIKTNLFTYVQEMRIAFITGNKNISEWDSYLKELDNIGLKKYMEVTQAAYDRMVG